MRQGVHFTSSIIWGARATKLCRVAPNICGSSMNLFHVTLLAP